MRRTFTLARMAAMLVVLTVIAASCGGNDSQAMPELDLATLEGETEFGTVKAQRADNSYTARVGEGRAIGVAFLEELGAGGSADQIAVQLYDGEDEAVMIGEVDPQGVATLVSGELSDFHASVELALEDDAATGTATLPSGERVAFTARATTGVAGVYWGRGTDEHPEVSCDWVVLSDGSQWGCVCFPPYTGPCCMMRAL